MNPFFDIQYPINDAKNSYLTQARHIARKIAKRNYSQLNPSQIENYDNPQYRTTSEFMSYIWKSDGYSFLNSIILGTLTMGTDPYLEDATKQENEWYLKESAVKYFKGLSHELAKNNLKLSDLHTSETRSGTPTSPRKNT